MLKIIKFCGLDLFSFMWTKINSDHIFLYPKVWCIFSYLNCYFLLLQYKLFSGNTRIDGKNDSARTYRLKTENGYIPISDSLVNFVEETLLYQTLYSKFQPHSKWGCGCRCGFSFESRYGGPSGSGFRVQLSAVAASMKHQKTSQIRNYRHPHPNPKKWFLMSDNHFLFVLLDYCSLQALFNTKSEPKYLL